MAVPMADRLCMCVQADVGELTSFYASLMQQVHWILQLIYMRQKHEI